MTAMRINRFSLSEISDVTIRCNKCGAGHIIKIDSERFSVDKCPSCGVPYGALATDMFELLQQTWGGLRIASESFDIEFDIVEK